MKRTEKEFKFFYGKYMTKKKLYYGTCIRLYNEICEMDILYEDFRDSDSSNSVLEKIGEAKKLLKEVYEEVK